MIKRYTKVQIVAPLPRVKSQTNQDVSVSVAVINLYEIPGSNELKLSGREGVI